MYWYNEVINNHLLPCLCFAKYGDEKQLIYYNDDLKIITYN